MYANKSHEKCGDIALELHSRIKISQIVLSAVAAGGFVATVFGAGSVGSIVGGTVSTILLVLNAYTKDHDLGRIAQKHKHTAADLWLIRESYLSLIVDHRDGHKEIQAVLEERDRLNQELHAIYSSAPSTTSGAYKRAQKALQRNEELTFSDSEIDAFLPASLRWTATSESPGH